ncbi:MAG: hypothetical protein E6Q61_01170 [Nitrosomonas sp.]|nr:MAG: hypothetical protein E6Q61_01170 [Nitrosomonas sp.]
MPIPAYPSTEIFSLLVDGMQSIDSEDIARKEKNSYSEEGLPFFPEENCRNKYQKNNEPEARFTPNISHHNSRQKCDKKYHTNMIQTLKILQGKHEIKQFKAPSSLVQ